ncbi:DUF116 domain-containing protein [Romboutsia sedimentorum]|uniref:DUF116 domain-containing protein n=1 Tax=Romboutsia sedimentorum TaxID=1368474 RepID=A0ABT7E8T4_9FIRM|nr:DUF116 domain-containing protein [Romboutsia sedimentorum]MDK2563122.1 DUF116 domain-containing protein [Romboutsia sedimentorum]
MIDSKKYMTTICILLGILIVSVVTINIFISSLTGIFTIFIDMIAAIISLSIIFSILITNKVIKDKKVNVLGMKINFKIVSLLFPMITFVADSVGISKNEIRKVYVKLNNKYIYSNKYNIKNEEILILIPHCVQKNSCKLKVTTNIETCAKCGLCNIGDLVKLKEKTNVNIFVATGGTLARKIIIDNKPKAIIAVACERDLTAGVQDVRKIPVLGVFNKRPNGPCVDTSIDVKEIEEAIKFFTSN